MAGGGRTNGGGGSPLALVEVVRVKGRERWEIRKK